MRQQQPQIYFQYTVRILLIWYKPLEISTKANTLLTDLKTRAVASSFISYAMIVKVIKDDISEQCSYHDGIVKIRICSLWTRAVAKRQTQTTITSISPLTLTTGLPTYQINYCSYLYLAAKTFVDSKFCRHLRDVPKQISCAVKTAKRLLTVIRKKHKQLKDANQSPSIRLATQYALTLRRQAQIAQSRLRLCHKRLRSQANFPPTDLKHQASLHYNFAIHFHEFPTSQNRSSKISTFECRTTRSDWFKKVLSNTLQPSIIRIRTRAPRNKKDLNGSASPSQ